MEFRKILPAAAGVIALTATVVFAKGYRESEEAGGVRIRISETEAGESLNSTSRGSVSTAMDSESGRVYRVEITRDGTSRVVLVEAQTGRVVRSMEAPGRVA